jgi:Mn-containing catalase
MLLHTGTEEIGHIEVLATAVAMNLDGLPSEQVDDVVTNPLVSARMGGIEPRHFLSGGLSAMPADANGVPFNAACIDVGGNLASNMRANVAAEAIGRSLAARLREMTDDPGMKDMLSFLIARDTMHQQQWMAALEDAGDTFVSAPNDVEDDPEHAKYAYAFFGHGEEPMDADARWLSGPSLDGKASSATWRRRAWARSPSSRPARPPPTAAWRPRDRPRATVPPAWSRSSRTR